MEIYKIRHKPTGKFIFTSYYHERYINVSNIFDISKTFYNKADLESFLEMIDVIEDGETSYSYRVKDGDLEVVVFQLTEIGTLKVDIIKD